MKASTKDKSGLSNIMLWPIGDITPYELNVKKHDKEQVAKIVQAINNYGWADAHAIIVNKHGVILSGHGRRLAAIELGLSHVKVQILDHLTPEQERAYRLAVNRVAISDTDTDMLRIELMNSDLDLAGIFDEKELDFMKSDMGAMNVDAFVTDMGAVLEEQRETVDGMAAAATDPDARIPLTKIFGFKDMSASAKIDAAVFMAKVEASTGLKEDQALEAFMRTFAKNVKEAVSND